MAQQTLNVGTNANDGTGDTLRVAMQKVNDMFTELYLSPLSGGDLEFSGNEIRAVRSNDDIVFKPAGTGAISMPAIRFNGNNIEGTRSNEDIRLLPAGTGSVVFGSLSISGTSLSSDDSTAININENLLVDGTATISGTATITGATTLQSTLDVTGATTLSTLDVTGNTTLAGTTTIDNLTFNDNIISSSSNADIRLEPGGTGAVVIASLTVDDNINITDNEITTTQSNSDLVLTPAGTGSVVITSDVDINGGTIDNTVIGGTTPAAGTFTTLTANTSVTIDGVTITDNTISASRSNDDLELAGSGSGTITINGFTFPLVDGSSGEFLQTNGAGQLSFANLSAPTTLNHSEIGDSTATVASSATSVIDTWDATAYRSAKYYISVSDTTNSRFEIVEANVVHGPSADSTTEAYISTFGNTTNHTDPLTTYTVDVLNETVRLKATNITNDSTVFKIQRVLIDL
jgi:phage protein U